MSEKRAKHSKKSISKSKVMTKDYQPEDEDDVNYDSVIEQQQYIPEPPPLPREFTKDKERPKGKTKKKSYDSDDREDSPPFNQQEQKKVIKMPPLPQEYAQKTERPRNKITKKGYEAEEQQNDDFGLFDDQEEEQVLRMPPIRQENKERSQGKIIVDYNSEEEMEEPEHYGPLLEQLQQKAMKMNPLQNQHASKNAAPTKLRPSKFASEPINRNYQKNIQQKFQPPFLSQQYQTNNTGFGDTVANPYIALPPLPPITITENLTDILQSKLQSPSVKAFKVNIYISLY